MSVVSSRNIEQFVLDLGVCGDSHWRTRLHNVTLVLASATDALRNALPPTRASPELAALEAILLRDDAVRINAVAQLIAVLLQCPSFATKRHLFGLVGAPADPHVVRFQSILADIQRDRLDVADALIAFLRVRDERDAAHHSLLDLMASAIALEEGLSSVDAEIVAARRSFADACTVIGISVDHSSVPDSLAQLVPQLSSACAAVSTLLRDEMIASALALLGDRARGESFIAMQRVSADSSLLHAAKQRELVLCALLELRSFLTARLVAARIAADDSVATDSPLSSASAPIDVDETNRIVNHLDAVRKALVEPQFLQLLQLATPALREQVTRKLESPQRVVELLTAKSERMSATLTSVQTTVAAQTAALREIDDRLELARVEFGELLSEASGKAIEIIL
jgi:hypothetical protein